VTPLSHIRVLIALSALACSGQLGASCQDFDRAIQPLCESVVSQLQTGNYAEIALELHEPSGYTAQHAAEDRLMARRHLEYLGAKFGQPRALHPVTKVDFYKLSVMRGDIAYWQSLPRMDLDSAATFLADFSEVGQLTYQ